MTTKLSKYNPAAIQVFDNLAAVRKRPGMYVGSVQAEGVFHLFREIVDNSIDELINGFGHVIVVTIINDHTISIADDGRGVPIGMHRKQKKKAIYLIYEHLHAGGKFNSENYKISSGLHGVGAAVVNALSSHFCIYTIADKAAYFVKYHKGGQRCGELTRLRGALPTWAQNLKTSGTAVQFTFDKTIFSQSIKYEFEQIKKYCEEKAYLCGKLKFEINDNRTGAHVTLAFLNELLDFQSHLTQNLDQVISKNIQFSAKIGDITIQIVFNYYSNLYSTEIKSFANYINTTNGGTHVIGFRQAVIKCFSNYMKQHNSLPSGGLLPNDILQGITAVISVMIPEKETVFEGQTKTKLSTTSVKNIVNRSTTEQLMKFLNFNKNTGLIIIKQILLNQKARISAKKVRAAILSDKNVRLSKVSLAGKLVKCFSKKAQECELFLVEGDSAGGTAKNARSRHNQAILPLKGKILNTYGMSSEAILSNKEVNSLITSLECGFSRNFDYDKLRYHKIIIMTDADTDGAHIRALLITLFWSHFFALLEKGHIYVACAPLFCATYTKKNVQHEHYFWSDKDLEVWLKSQEKKCYVQRYKGLGEMNAKQLRDTTMNPQHRKLLQLRIADKEQASKEIDILMGNNAELRKAWINKNIDFSESEIK